MSDSAAGPDCSFAFQPIVALADGRVAAYEALARGRAGEPAAEVLARLDSELGEALDTVLHRHALRQASELGLEADISLNLMPRNVENIGDLLERTLRLGETLRIGPERITVEIVETEIIRDAGRFLAAANRLRAAGVRLAIDDFGAGFAGLTLLTRFQPDCVKIDMSIVRDIDASGPRQAIVHGIIRTCTDLGIDLVAEGIESEAEFDWCRREGIHFGQGYYIARPGFESLPPAVFAAID